MPDGGFTNEPKPPGTEDVERPQTAEGLPWGSDSDRKSPECCGVPRRKACCLIFVTFAIVVAVGAGVGVVVGQHQQKGEDEGPPGPPKWFKPPPPIELVSDPEARFNIIRSAMEAQSLLTNQVAALPATAQALQDGSAENGNGVHKALNWVVNEDTLLDKAQLAERFALAVVYFEQEGDSWNNKENWLTAASHCDWYGVQCCEGAFGAASPHCRTLLSTRNTTIAEFDVHRNNLGGTISDFVVLLRDLYSLRLSENRITGPVRGELVLALPFLHILDIQHNQLTGNVPSNLLDGNLDTLFINGNPGLEGDFPIQYCRGSTNLFRYLKLDCEVTHCFCCGWDMCIDG